MDMPEMGALAYPEFEPFAEVGQWESEPESVVGAPPWRRHLRRPHSLRSYS